MGMVSFTHTITSTTTVFRSESCDGEEPKFEHDHGTRTRTGIWKVTGLGSIIERIIPPSQLAAYNIGKRFFSVSVRNPISHSFTQDGKLIDIGKWYQNAQTLWLYESSASGSWPVESTIYNKYIRPGLTIKCVLTYGSSWATSYSTKMTIDGEIFPPPTPTPSPSPSPSPTPTPEPECDCDYNAIAREMRSKHADLFKLVNR